MIRVTKGSSGSAISRKGSKLSFLNDISYYASLSQNFEDSRWLFNICSLQTVMITIVIGASIFHHNMDSAKQGVDEIMHISCYVFSLYAILKSKSNPTDRFTFGFSRIETIAAFSNCVFLVISSLFLLLAAFHDHEEGNSDSQAVAEGD